MGKEPRFETEADDTVTTVPPYQMQPANPHSLRQLSPQYIADPMVLNFLATKQLQLLNETALRLICWFWGNNGPFMVEGRSHRL